MVSSLFPVISELVQQHTSTIVSNGEVLAPSRKIHRGDMTQRGLRRRPISKGGERREVDLSISDASVSDKKASLKLRTKRN